jgi:hypothetical protein
VVDTDVVDRGGVTSMVLPDADDPDPVEDVLPVAAEEGKEEAWDVLLADDAEGTEYPAEVLVLPLELTLLAGEADELLEGCWLDGIE